ncbi:MAG: hypothetical protein ACT4P3_21285 [Betaproteobacteria bacterium]
MKRMAIVLAFALAAPAWAQEQKPAPKEPEKKEPAKMASKKPNPKRFEDARHCLEKPTSTEIIKCSEEYL